MNEMAPYGWEDDGAKTTPWHLFVALAKLVGIVLFVIALRDAVRLFQMVVSRANFQEMGIDVSKLSSIVPYCLRVGFALAFGSLLTFGCGWLTSVLNLQPARAERRLSPRDLFVVVGKLVGLVLIFQEIRAHLSWPAFRSPSGLQLSLLLAELVLIALLTFFTDPLARWMGLTATGATSEQRTALFRGGLVLMALYILITSLPGVVTGLTFEGFSDDFTLRQIFMAALAGWTLLRSAQIARWVDLGPSASSADPETTDRTPQPASAH